MAMGSAYRKMRNVQRVIVFTLLHLYSKERIFSISRVAVQEDIGSRGIQVLRAG